MNLNKEVAKEAVTLSPMIYQGVWERAGKTTAYLIHSFHVAIQHD